MADGVKPADVYKVLATKDGAERAFKKLSELKPQHPVVGGGRAAAAVPGRRRRGR